MTKLEQFKSAAFAIPMGHWYLKNAFVLAEQAKRLEDDPPANSFVRTTLHSSHVTSSLLATACALEATINEWFTFSDEIDVRHDEAARSRIQKLWRLGIPRTASFQILQKYQVGLTLAGEPLLTEGEEPYQSARLVVDLRNWLVHYEPTWEPLTTHEESGEYPPHRLVKRLRGKFAENPLCTPDAPFWPLKCLGAGCALWAAEAATAFLNEFFARCDPESVLRPDIQSLDRARELGRAATWRDYGK
ncbi:hypothetical protein [Ramlibacter tataouinensis]|uniref:hypothetical protein n=1 Tax=Ramlibacter tataouinensis TaxID=94132 RepID=UPI00117D3D43|nr:hypothetical protein [Ramlibacter tataouinensis]